MNNTATTAPAVWIYSFSVTVTQTNGHSYFLNGLTHSEALRKAAELNRRSDVATVVVLDNGKAV